MTTRLNTTYDTPGVPYDSDIAYDGIILANAYTDVATVKDRLGETRTTNDVRLASIITAVSRWIDAETHRFFGINEGQTRYYSAGHVVELWVDDFLGITSLATDSDGDGVYETTWAASDYYTLPVNARLESPAQPYSHLRISLNGHYSFPEHIPNGVQIVGDFGFDAIVPIVIQEATILQTTRLWKRGDAPFGVSGSAEMGQSIVIPRLDPDVRMMLWPYRRLTVG